MNSVVWFCVRIILAFVFFNTYQYTSAVTFDKFFFVYSITAFHTNSKDCSTSAVYKLSLKNLKFAFFFFRWKAL